MREFQVGLLHFSEPFGDALKDVIAGMDPIEDRHGRSVRLHAEHMAVTEFDIDFRSRYGLVIDRGSYRLPIARGVLMTHAFRGVHVINNPLSFHYFIAHKDVGYSIARDLGVSVPPTFVLPPRSTPGFSEEDFRYHRGFAWEKIAEKVGFPAFLKPAEGRGAQGVSYCCDLQELLAAYNASGNESMTLQAAVSSPHKWHLRCLCIGREVMVIKYIFRSGDRSEYLPEGEFLAPEVEQEVVESARIINRAFGYEMNSVEFILDHDGRPWAIDFNNPVPDGRREELGSVYFSRYIDALARRAGELAADDRPGLFLPDLNAFSAIAQTDESLAKRRSAALRVANAYYEPEEK